MVHYLADDELLKHPTHPEDFIRYRKGMGGTLEIFDIAVMSERGKGRGRELIKMLLNLVAGHNTHDADLPKIRVVFAITRWSNTIAQQFYEAVGFRIVGRLHNFYREDNPPEHGIMYGIDL